MILQFPIGRESAMITPATNLKGTGFKQYINQLKLLLKVFLYPPVIYSGFCWGIQNALLTFYLTVEDDQYYDPPYSYGNIAVGLMNIPCLIGAIICFALFQIISRYIWLKGIKEFRKLNIDYGFIATGYYRPVGLIWQLVQIKCGAGFLLILGLFWFWVWLCW